MSSMRRFIALALLTAVAVAPVCAQRGGAHGGFSGHSGGFSGHTGSAFHSGFPASAPSRLSGGFSANRFSAPPISSFRTTPSFRTAPSLNRGGFGAYNRRPYNGSNSYRRVYVWRNGAGFSYVVPGWIGYGYPGYGYDAGYDDSAASADNGAPVYEAPPEDQEQTAARNPYEAYPEPSSPSPTPQNENATTVVFKDGRPSEQIHNYALTRTTLFVLDEHHRDIPTDEIDLSATERVNRDAGIEFQLPVSLR
jgi:hypothetical protein